VTTVFERSYRPGVFGVTGQIVGLLGFLACGGPLLTLAWFRRPELSVLIVVHFWIVSAITLTLITMILTYRRGFRVQRNDLGISIEKYFTTLFSRLESRFDLPPPREVLLCKRPGQYPNESYSVVVMGMGYAIYLDTSTIHYDSRQVIAELGSMLKVSGRDVSQPSDDKRDVQDKFTRLDSPTAWPVPPTDSRIRVLIDKEEVQFTLPPIVPRISAMVAIYVTLGVMSALTATMLITSKAWQEPGFDAVKLGGLLFVIGFVSTFAAAIWQTIVLRRPVGPSYVVSPSGIRRGQLRVTTKATEACDFDLVVMAPSQVSYPFAEPSSGELVCLRSGGDQRLSIGSQLTPTERIWLGHAILAAKAGKRPGA
jgi:hypothetical protein